MLEVIGKASPKAKALIGAALILVAGIKGLPFEEDAEDIIDTIGQALGYRTNSGKEIELAAYKASRPDARRPAAARCHRHRRGAVRCLAAHGHGEHHPGTGVFHSRRTRTPR